MTKNQLIALKSAVSCCVMKGASFTGDAKKNDEIKEAVRLYIQTWIQAPIQAVIDKEEGGKNFENDEYLSSIATNFYCQKEYETYNQLHEKSN
jgi:hypothetical protein